MCKIQKLWFHCVKSFTLVRGRATVLPRRSVQWLPLLVHQPREKIPLDFVYDFERHYRQTCNRLVRQRACIDNETNQPVKIATAMLTPINTPSSILVPAHIHWIFKAWPDSCHDVRVSIWLRCSPSDSSANLDPMKVWRRIFGKMKKVATTNCHSFTVCIDYEEVSLFKILTVVQKY